MNAKKLGTVSALALALVIGLMIFGGSKTRAAGPTCAVGPSGDYTTIQGAVNDGGCTTINVAAGTYNELVSISRTVTINGAQVGVDARTRAVPVASESVVGSGNGAFQILADNVVIDGFTIQGVNLDQTTNPGALGAGIWTNPGFNGTQGGHQIRNNIIQNNVIGIELDNVGTFPARVERNLIRNNNETGADGGTGIDTNFGLVNAVIDNNKFVGHTNSGIDLVNAGGSNLTFSNNEFDSNRRAIGLGVVTSSAITGNNIHDSNDLLTADIRVFGGVSGLSISCNRLANGLGRAIRINDAGFGPSSNISINQNNISGYPTGLEENLGGYTGGFNSLDATNNWWGSSTGPTIGSNPGGTGELIIDEDGVVKYSPFLTSPSTCAPVIDLCPNDPNKTAPGQCGCGIPDTDTDGDGTADCHDLCPADPHKTAPGACGCGVPDTDTDHDGIPDCHDNCPTIPNPSQADADHDGIGDACEAGADLRVTKSAKTKVKTGTKLTYVVTVRNLGPNSAPNVVITDALPAGTTFISASPTKGSCSNAGNLVTCNIGNLNNGRSAAIILVVKVTASAGTTITNTAQGSSSHPDPNLSNNTASAKTKVVKPNDDDNDDRDKRDDRDDREDRDDRDRNDH
jgi:uncharacterized repeat protein (TIGR01451 family)